MAKVLLSVADALLRRIDALARAEGKTRSRFLVERALREGAAQPRPIDDPRVRRALAGIVRARKERWSPGPSAQALIRQAREERDSRLLRH